MSRLSFFFSNVVCKLRDLTWEDVYYSKDLDTQRFLTSKLHFFFLKLLYFRRIAVTEVLLECSLQNSALVIFYILTGH